jgi:hypothetical protein
VFRAAAARADGVAKWRLHSKRRSVSCILQHGLPWRRLPETLSRANYKQTLRVFLTIVVYRVIVRSVVTSLQTCESVTFFLNFPVLVDQNEVVTTLKKYPIIMAYYLMTAERKTTDI